MKKGFTIQLLNKNNGQAVRRKWFLTVTAAQAWLDWQYPHWKEMYNMEIFCDQEGESSPSFCAPASGQRGRIFVNCTQDKK